MRFGCEVVTEDGGVRRGSDILKKAPVLGAAAAMSCATELEMATALTGRPTIARINRSPIRPVKGTAKG